MGTLDLRVFDQATWWVDINQQPHRLTEMSEEYLSNVLGFLDLYADEYHLATTRRLALEELGDALLGRASAETVSRAAGAPATAELTHKAWLEATPLMRGLRAELLRRGQEPPDCDGQDQDDSLL